MSGTPKKAIVNVVLTSEKPIEFSVTSTDLPIVDGSLVFENDHHPGFNVDFQFKDDTGLNYLFPTNNDKQQAVWSKLGSSCPKIEANDVFKVIQVDSKRLILTVHNPNPKPAEGQFQYTLRVTKDGGATYLPLDPGGVNQNGPTQRLTSAALAFVAGGVVGSMLTLGTQAVLAS